MQSIFNFAYIDTILSCGLVLFDCSLITKHILVPGIKWTCVTKDFVYSLHQNLLELNLYLSFLLFR